MTTKKVKRHVRIMAVLLLSVFCFAEIIPFTREPLIGSRKEIENLSISQGEENEQTFLYINDIDQNSYMFTGSGSSFLLAEVIDTAFTYVYLDNNRYNLSYGFNQYPLKFDDEPTEHSLQIDNSEVDYFKWISIEPMFIQEDKLEVTLDTDSYINFDAAGPISVLVKLNFSYHLLSLEILEQGTISHLLKTKFNLDNSLSEINSDFYSYFTEDGEYLRYNLDLEAGSHLMKVSGDGTFEYKIMVNLDWDGDHLNDVDEIQWSDRYDFNPEIPNSWGYFEKGGKISYGYSEDIVKGFFSFYIPHTSYQQSHFLFIDIKNGEFSEFIFNGDDQMLKDVVLSASYPDTKPISEPYGWINSGWHSMQYSYRFELYSEISFRINTEQIPVVEIEEYTDTDGDGVKDVAEVGLNTDKYNPDSDSDGLLDNLDGSPSRAILLRKNKMCQIVIPHNSSKNTVLNMIVKKPSFDYSTYGKLRKWHDVYNVSISFVMRMYGNSTISRSNLLKFWKDSPANVQSYCLVDNYNYRGVGDAIPNAADPQSEYGISFGYPSEDSFEFELVYPIGHAAKSDTRIDLRFDFIWLISRYNDTTKEHDIIHFYDSDEDIMIQSMIRREMDSVNYILGSPDSVIEHELLYLMIQNPDIEIESPAGFDIDSDIINSDIVDYFALDDQILEDRENYPILKTFSATYSFENTPLGNILPPPWTYTTIGDSSSVEIIESWIDNEDNEHTKALYCRDKVTLISDFLIPQESGTYEFWTLYDRQSSSNELRFGLKNENNQFTCLILEEENHFKFYDGAMKISTGLPFVKNMWYRISVDFSNDGTYSHLGAHQYRFRIYGGDGKTLLYESSNLNFMYNGKSNRLYFDSSEIESGEFFLDAIGLSWDEEYFPGQNIAAVGIENEVLYIGGLQSNYDILGKLNIENIINVEKRKEGDYAIYLSYYKISNVISDEMSRIASGENMDEYKVCFTIGLNDEYTTSDYKYTVSSVDYPISVTIKQFGTPAILETIVKAGVKNTNKFFKKVGKTLTKIVENTRVQLIDKLTNDYKIKLDFDEDAYKKHTDLEVQYESIDKILDNAVQINEFYEKLKVDIPSISKSIREIINDFDSEGYRSSNLELSSVLKSMDDDLNELKGSGLADSPSLFMDVKKKLLEIEDLQASFEKSDISKDGIASIDYLNRFDELLDKAQELTTTFDDIENVMVKLQNEFSEFNPDFMGKFLLDTDDLQTRLNMAKKGIKDLQKQIRRSKIAQGIMGGIMLVVYFLVDFQDQMKELMDFLSGKEPIPDIMSLVKFCYRQISGFACILSNTLLVLNGLRAMPKLAKIPKLEKLFSFSKTLGKVLIWVGIIIEIIHAAIDLYYAIIEFQETGDWGKLVFHIVTIVIIYGVVGIYLGYVWTAAATTAAATYGISLAVALAVTLLTLLTIFTYNLYSPSMYVVQKETIDGQEVDTTYFTLPLDNIKKQGSLEVGDNIRFTIKVRNNGTDPIFQITYLTAAFKLDGEWSDYQGRWTDYISSVFAFPPTAPYYNQGESDVLVFERTIMNPTDNLEGCFYMKIDGVKMVWFPFPWWIRENLYADYTDIDFETFVLQNNIRAFYDDTEEVGRIETQQVLEHDLKNKLLRFQWKDADELLNKLRALGYSENIELPICTNIQTNLNEQLLEIDPVVGQMDGEFTLDLDGNDHPPVNYEFIVPEGFSITPNSEHRILGGYYPGTFDFEKEVVGTSGTNIDFVDFDFSTGTSGVSIHRPAGFHGKIIDCHKTWDGLWSMTHNLEQELTSGTVEFYWRTTTLLFNNPWIFSFADEDLNWGTILYQNALDFGTLWFFGPNGQYYDLNFLPFINTWYHFRIDFDTAENKWTLIINGNIIGKDLPFISEDVDAMKYIHMRSFEAAIPHHIYYDAFGITGQSDEYEIGNNKHLYNGFEYTLSIDNPKEQKGGMYHFELVIKHDVTGELLYYEQVPFKVKFHRDLDYSQSNTLMKEQFDDLPWTLSDNNYAKLSQECELLHVQSNASQTLDIIGPSHLIPLDLNIGDDILIHCTTDTANEVVVKLMYQGVLVKAYPVIPRGNLFHDMQFIKILIDEEITIDQLIISGNFEVGEFFSIHEIMITNSHFEPEPNTFFNPLSFENNGNVPEVIEFSLTGINLEDVDVSSYPGEFQDGKLIVYLMPNENIEMYFNISSPTDPISNLLHRGITVKDPYTTSIHTKYIDSFQIVGIHLLSPMNVTYNNFGKSYFPDDVYFDENFYINIVSGEELNWIAYSLDGQPFVPFLDNSYIYVPTSEETHRIQVKGRNVYDEEFFSDIIYFSIEYPIKILSPGDIIYTRPEKGRYLSTYGFDGQAVGTQSSDIDFIDIDSSDGTSGVQIIGHMDGHSGVLEASNTGAGIWGFSKKLDNPISAGIIEFYWRTTSYDSSPWIIGLTDNNQNWGPILYQNQLDGGDLWYFIPGPYFGYSYIDLGFRPSLNTWHHFKIGFDASTKTWAVSIDGKLKGQDLPFANSLTTEIGSIHMRATNQENIYKAYYDAISFSWDGNYEVGDNLKEGISIRYSSKVQNLGNFKYSLNGGSKVSYKSLMKLPPDGQYSIILYGTRSCGEEIRSKIVSFEIARKIDMASPENQTYIRAMNGYYPATYGFEDKQDTMDWVNLGFEREVIVNDKGNHKGVLYLQNSDLFTLAQYVNLFSSRSSGIIELWHFPFYAFFGASHIVALGGGQLYCNLFAQYVWNYGGHDYIVANLVTDRWNHLKFVFNNGFVNIYVNGILKTVAFINPQLNYLSFAEYHGYGMWIDAVGYSWDPNYNIGDNTKEGILLDIDVPTDVNIESIEYKLDSNDPITISGDTVIPYMEPGRHKLQVIGYDENSNIYYSDIQRFSIYAKEIPTPVGTDVRIEDPYMGVVIYFDEVTTSGITKVEEKSILIPPPSGYTIFDKFLDITTTASYLGDITIGFYYDETSLNVPETDLKVLQYQTNEWVDTTSFIDSENNYIYCVMTHLSYFVIVEPDITPPDIVIQYLDGDKTDGNPGLVNVFAYDTGSGIDEDSIKVLINNQQVGTEFGNYTIPHEIGIHDIHVEVKNNDPFSMLATKDLSIQIKDDDTSNPKISLNYYGSFNDSNPGFFMWNILDTDSAIGGDFDVGLSEIEIQINFQSTTNMEDYTLYLPGVQDGFWDLPSCVGIYTIEIHVRDNDNDRDGDSLTTEETYSVTLTDDDITPPVLTLEHTGGTTDEDSGQIQLSFSDPESDATAELTILGPNGFSYTKNYASEGSDVIYLHDIGICKLGAYIITLNVENNDDDEWVGDEETDSTSITLNIEDDDITPPDLALEHTGGTTDEDSGQIQLSFSDPESDSTAVLTILGPNGFSYTNNYALEGSHIINLPDIEICELGTYTITLYVDNNDEDGWIGDEETDSRTITLTIEDDDTEKPFITFTEDSYSWDGDLIILLFTVTAEDVDSGVSEIVIKIEDQTFYGAGTHSVSSLSNFYTLEIWVTDDDNDRPNDALTKYELYNLIFDLEPPITTTIPIGSEGLSGWFTSDVTVEVTAEDDTSGVAFTRYNVDSGEWFIEYGTFSILLLKEGTSTIEYYSVDNLGNVEELKTLIVKIDKEAPVTFHSLQPDTPDGDNGWYVSPVEMTFLPDDITSGVIETYYRVNGGFDMVYTGPLTFSVDTTYTVEYWSIDEAGLVECVNSVHFKIDRTDPFTSLTIGTPKYSSNPTYVTTETEYELDAIDLGSDIKEIKYQIDSIDPEGWQTYTTPFTIENFGSHTIYYYSIDMAGNADDIKSENVEVNLTELTYWGEVCGNYSDPVSLKATLIDIASQLPIPDKFILFTIGDQTISAQTDFQGIASATIILTQKSGLYTVSASFVGDEEYLASESGEYGFTINKEHAYAEYTGDMVVPLNAETITLRATIFDDDDCNWGDLTKIYVTITILDSATYLPLASHTYNALQVESTSVYGVGVALLPIDNVFTSEGEYLVQISFESSENDYYYGDNSMPVVLIIYEPKGDFVTGGGWIEDANGNKGNFGFNVKYKKNGLPKGQAIYVYREDEYIYIVKANAWVGMAIVSEDNYTIFEAKCNVKQIDALTGDIVWEEGNFRLIIEAWDHSQDGKQDVFQVRVYDKIGLIYYESGFDPYGFLSGGNIVIHIDKKKK